MGGKAGTLVMLSSVEVCYRTAECVAALRGNDREDSAAWPPRVGRLLVDLLGASLLLPTDCST